MKEDVQSIHIGEIIRQKSGKTAPRVVVRLLEKLIHQDEINYILSNYGHLSGLAFVKALMSYFDVRSEWINPQNLPDSGRCIFVCNHPLGAYDGITISHLVGTHYGDVRYVVNDLLYNLEPLRPIFIPVNKFGRQSKDSVRMLDQTLQSNIPLVSFPAGICSRKIDGKIQDLPWAKSFVKQAIEYDRPIVPLFFDGKNSNLFYNIELVRKWFGIKLNVGMALLPHEMFGVKHKRFDVYVGKPIMPCEIDSYGKTPKEIAQAIRKLVYTLKKK
ncbi:1-acyl-sn-glycerol-3-phosphate acyltransferase [Falsiporphyromonas endometrii]|uniref:1-acyl-sn-glycerol-3-phosphate acyltransferase n=1 Tax=Falsiporphyromonas endometrii TaxID=1387297 RepID=A0ABV9KAX3_9PORP